MTVLAQVLIAVGVLAAAFVVGIIYSALDAKSEKRRKSFYAVAVKLREWGLERLPAILEDLAVGDYSGACQQIEKFEILLEQGPDAVAKEFDDVFDRVLDHKLGTPEGLALIKAHVDAATKTQSTPAAALPAALVA